MYTQKNAPLVSVLDTGGKSREGEPDGNPSVSIDQAGGHTPGAAQGPVADLAEQRTALLSELYRRHWRELRNYIHKTFGAGPPEPEDVAQAAFTRFAALKAPATIDNPRAFLYTTARNIVIDSRRRAGTARAHQHDISPDEDDPGHEFSPEHVSIVRERLSIIMDTIDRMPEKRRRMLLLNRLDGLNLSEIGRRLGMSEGGVRKHVKNALSDCLRALEESDADNSDGDTATEKGKEDPRE